MKELKELRETIFDRKNDLIDMITDDLQGTTEFDRGRYVGRLLEIEFIMNYINDNVEFDEE